MNNIDLKNLNKIHFVGIGGISMSALAMVCLSKGKQVSGSDSGNGDILKELTAKGAVIFSGHNASNITSDISLLVYTAAVKEDNPELVRARELGIPLASRAEFLGTIMRLYKTAIGVSGTHGKTTTTSMLSHILLGQDTDPTIMVGGMLPAIGGNLRIGNSDTFITEACEYTNSFLSFAPTVGVILNVAADHLDFFKDLDDIRLSFRKYAELLPAGGALVINSEIDKLSYFTEGLSCRVVTFSAKKELHIKDGEACVHFYPENVVYSDMACPEFDLYMANAAGEQLITHVKLSVPGEHNLLNALAALACSYACGLDVKKAAASLTKFSGADRRFQHKGEVHGITIIDDYAHHPDEITATLTAAKNCKAGNVWVVFQPHTYTRTKALFEEFTTALSAADKVVLADIYAAREKNTIGISSLDLKNNLEKNGVNAYYFPSFEEIEDFVLTNCVPGDMLITMGAGDVYKIGENILGL